MAILPKANYRFNEIPIKIPTQVFTDMERAGLNIIWKKSRIAKKFSTMKKSSRGITIPDLKLYYKAIVINTTQYWYRDRLINGIESKNQK